MKLEIKTRRELLNDFIKEDFVTKANIIDKLDTEKWVSVKSLYEIILYLGSNDKTLLDLYDLVHKEIKKVE